MTEATHSATIIDLNVYRSMRKQRRSANSNGPWPNVGANPLFGALAMPLYCFWPTWVWVPVAVPVTPSMQWDAS